MKKIKKTSQFQMRIHDDVLYWWSQFAKARGMPMSRMVMAAVTEWLKNHPEQEVETPDQKRARALKDLSEMSTRASA